MIRAAIFDMDGLMLDTEPAYRVAWQAAAAECGYDLPDPLYLTLIGRGRSEGEQTLADAFGPQFPVTAFRAACLRREAELFATTPVPKKPGLDRLLDLLDSKGIVKAVATSTERRTAAAQLATAGLLDRFDAVATGDEVVNGKPAPDLFLLAAQRLGVSPVRCIVFEDAEAGTIAAHSAGMTVFIVPDLKQPSEAVRRLAQGVFESLTEVAAFLAHGSDTLGSVPAPQREPADQVDQPE